MRALIGTAPDTPLVYLLAALEVVWLASAAAVVLSLTGLTVYTARRLPGRAAARARRLLAAVRPAPALAEAPAESPFRPALEPPP
jgi:predicted small integral membrane protein